MDERLVPVTALDINTEELSCNISKIVSLVS